DDKFLAGRIDIEGLFGADRMGVPLRVGDALLILILLAGPEYFLVFLPEDIRLFFFEEIIIGFSQQVLACVPGKMAERVVQLDKAVTVILDKKGVRQGIDYRVKVGI